MLFRLKDGYEHLEPLGWQRLRLVSCLDSSPWSVHFEPRRDENLFAAFGEWTRKVVSAYGGETGPGSEVLLALLGASRLLTGDIGGADVILDNLPEKPFELDHGAGYCLVLPMNALRAALPLPGPHLQDISRWLAGSAEQASLRSWLQQHKAQLMWDEARGVYTLAATSAGAHDIDSDELRDAITRLSRLERIDEMRLPPGLPLSDEAEASDVLTRVGPTVVPKLEAALATASGTGRVAITKVVMQLDPQRARAILLNLIHDDTPATVNTCLVGFRTVKDWAHNIAGNLARLGVEPIELPVTRTRTPRFSSAQRWLIAGLVIVAVWSYLKWWAP